MNTIKLSFNPVWFDTTKKCWVGEMPNLNETVLVVTKSGETKVMQFSYHNTCIIRGSDINKNRTFCSGCSYIDPRYNSILAWARVDMGD